MSSQFDDVGLFHERFGLDNTTVREVGPRDVPDTLLKFRIKFLREELKEFEEAAATHDEAKMFDALIDLVYVAFGTAHIYGFPWHAGWDAVQFANMQKVRATHVNQSARASTFDVVKPEGWRAPDLERLLRHSGWPEEHLKPRHVTSPNQARDLFNDDIPIVPGTKPIARERLCLATGWCAAERLPDSKYCAAHQNVTVNENDASQR